MDKKNIFGLITLITSIGIGANARFAVSAELAALPRAGQESQSFEATRPYINDNIMKMASSVIALENVQKSDLAAENEIPIPPSQLKKETESREVISPAHSEDAALDAFNSFALYLTRKKKSEDEKAGKSEKLEVRAELRSGNSIPSIIEISSNQDGELNYVSVTWDNPSNKP